MSERSELLHQAADQQIADLLEITDRLTPDTLQRPCPGRQKLGDGTLGALVAHTTDNYKRIAAFASGQTGDPDGDTPPRGAHSMPRFLRALGHRPPDHSTACSADSAQPNEIGLQLHTVRVPCDMLRHSATHSWTRYRPTAVSGSATASVRSSRF